jgi:Arc/MetJ-type ribon-helix-helix transcriptional regulator
MVRVDAKTVQTLDAWIEAGAADSRSEAAALFIREGLKVRASELTALEDALAELRKAKEQLSEKARSILQK